MNLTAFPLDPATDRTFERLLIEPIVAARHVPDRPEVWFDLGSGGGSPAIPIKILRPALLLTMVEAKARKTAFLREVVRTLGLPQVAVENAPFADLASRCPAVAQWVTARGVRIDRAFSTAAAILTALDGRLLLFRSRGPEQVLPEFVLRETVPLLASDGSCLTIYDRV